jgi:chemotaxis protein histidine kinase CheA
MKRLLLLIFDPSWLLLIFGWPILVALAIYAAFPSNMDNFVDAAPEGGMQLAIAREIMGAKQRVALEFAASVLRKVAAIVPRDGRDDIDRARADIQTEIERSYQFPKPAAKPSPTDKPSNTPAEKPADKPAGKSPDKAADKSAEKTNDKPLADKSASDEVTAADSTDSADDLSKLSAKERRRPEKAKRAVERAAERAKRAAERDSGNGFGIQLDDKGRVHTDFPLIDEQRYTELEAKYGNDTLPVLDLSYKQRIRSEIEQRAHQFIFGVLAAILLVLVWPFLFLSKIVLSIIRAFSSRTEQAKKVAEQNSLERQLSEARLAAMQAQIEPHFLFNTMASVQQLIETDPEAAAKMQANLIKYLRGAVPQMRESTTTLGREFDLSTAYLDILKIRMENRLSYSIDLPLALAAVNFPTMMLPTLVENAIKHGLEPRTEGGEIRITAAQAGGKLRVCVADTGMGFSNQPGKGVGLTNIRERLVALYGKQAQLIIEPNQPRGTKATIEIPYLGARS